MTSGEAVMQRSQDGGLAVGVAANGENLTVLRDTASECRQDVLREGTCSQEEER